MWNKNKPIEEKTDRNEISNKIEVNDGEKRRAAMLNGDRWDVYFDGKHTHLNNSLRYRYIFRLLENPKKKFFCVDLQNLVSGKQPEVSEEHKETKEIYEEMVPDQLEKEGLTNNLDDIMKDTFSKHEIERLEKIIYDCWDNLTQKKLSSEDEWEKTRNYLLNEYSIKVFIVKNEPKYKLLTRLTPGAKKARVNVRNNIKNALESIKAKMPALYKHLRTRIKTGIRCSYEIESSELTSWNIDWGE